jgi:spermidine/putrescine transport system ATP-binding protein
MVDKTHVRFLWHTFECKENGQFSNGSKVNVNIDFRKVILQDNEEDGMLRGDVNFILYKGDHYHLTVLTDDDENIFVDTNDVWDDGDRVGITIPPEAIQIVNL